MNRIFRALLPLAMASAFVPATAARAGEEMTPGEKSTLSTMLVVSTPVFVSLAASGMVASAPAAAIHAGKRARARGDMPPMRVESVEKREGGRFEVDLQDPEVPGNKGRLIWQGRDDDPTGGFRVGDLVRFTPSEGGSGWLVKSADGVELAFVPTAEAAEDNASSPWQ